MDLFTDTHYKVRRAKMKVNPFDFAGRHVMPLLKKRLIDILYREYSLTQMKISELTGMSQATISKYADGYRGMSQVVKLPPYVEARIRELALNVKEGKVRGIEVEFQLTKLVLELLSSGVLCKYHALIDNRDVAVGCKICLTLFKT